MKHITRFTSLALALIIAVTCCLPASVAHASQGAVYFKPGSGSYTIGKSFTVQVWVDVQQQTPLYHTSKGSVTFPSSLLQATRAVNANSGADFALSINQSQGRVNFNTMLWGNLSAGFQAHVFNITFKVKKAGTARLALASGTIFFDGPTSVRQASYRLKVPPCPSGQIGTWPHCHKPAPPKQPSPPPPTTSTPTPPKQSPSNPPSTSSPRQPTNEATASSGSTIPPENSAPLSDDSTNDDSGDNISNASNGLSIGSVTSSATYTSADISWLTNRISTTTFAYGTAKDALNLAADVSDGEQNSYSTTLTALEPGMTYYYQISATGADDSTTYAGQFQTKGYPITLTITQNGTPLSNATLVVGDDPTSYMTDENGTVSLNLSAGDHPITIKKDGGQSQETITVKALPITDGKDPDTQNITIATSLQITASAATGGSSMLAIGIILFVLLLLGAVGTVIVIKRRTSRTTAATEAPTFDDSFWSNVPGASGVTEDVYGNPVYQPPAASAAATPPEAVPYAYDSQPAAYPDAQQPVATYAAPANQYATPAEAYPTADQYYSELSAATQDPTNYGYSAAAPPVDAAQSQQMTATTDPTAYQYAPATPGYDQVPYDASSQPPVTPPDLAGQPSYPQQSPTDSAVPPLPQQSY